MKEPSTKVIKNYKMAKGKGRHVSTMERAQRIQDIVARYYEEGNQKRCLKAVWRLYVYPLYPMHYRTFLRHVGLDVEAEQSARSRALQSTLFDFWDANINPYAKTSR